MLSDLQSPGCDIELINKTLVVFENVLQEQNHEEFSEKLVNKSLHPLCGNPLDAGHNQEDIELANKLGHHSLGYLLQRDRRFEEALAETPWLVVQDLNGVAVVQSDSFILEELSGSDLCESLEDEECMITESHPITVSSSVPVLKKTQNLLVKSSLSFSSSGYYSNYSILESIQIEHVKTQPLELHFVASNPAIANKENETSPKESEFPQALYEDSPQYNLASSYEEVVKLAEQVGHHSLGYLLQRDKKFEEALAETPWLTKQGLNGVITVCSDSFILEELSSSLPFDDDEASTDPAQLYDPSFPDHSMYADDHNIASAAMKSDCENIVSTSSSRKTLVPGHGDCVYPCATTDLKGESQSDIKLTSMYISPYTLSPTTDTSGPNMRWERVMSLEAIAMSSPCEGESSSSSIPTMTETAPLWKEYERKEYERLPSFIEVVTLLAREENASSTTSTTFKPFNSTCNVKRKWADSMALCPENVNTWECTMSTPAEEEEKVTSFSASAGSFSAREEEKASSVSASDLTTLMCEAAAEPVLLTTNALLEERESTITVSQAAPPLVDATLHFDQSAQCGLVCSLSQAVTNSCSSASRNALLVKISELLGGLQVSPPGQASVEDGYSVSDISAVEPASSMQIPSGHSASSITLMEPTNSTPATESATSMWGDPSTQSLCPENMNECMAVSMSLPAEEDKKAALLSTYDVKAITLPSREASLFSASELKTSSLSASDLTKLKCEAAPPKPSSTTAVMEEWESVRQSPSLSVDTTSDQSAQCDFVCSFTNSCLSAPSNDAQDISLFVKISELGSLRLEDRAVCSIPDKVVNESESLLVESVTSTHLMAAVSSTATEWGWGVVPSIFVSPPDSPQFFEEGNFSYSTTCLPQDEDLSGQMQNYADETFALASLPYDVKEPQLLEEGNFLFAFASFPEDTVGSLPKCVDSPQFFEERNFSFATTPKAENFSFAATLPPQDAHLETRQFFEEEDFHFLTCNFLQDTELCIDVNSPVQPGACLDMETIATSHLGVSSVGTDLTSTPSKLEPSSQAVHNIMPPLDLSLLEELPFSFSATSFQVQDKQAWFIDDSANSSHNVEHQRMSPAATHSALPSTSTVYGYPSTSVAKLCVVPPVTSSLILSASSKSVAAMCSDNKDPFFVDCSAVVMCKESLPQVPELNYYSPSIAASSNNQPQPVSTPVNQQVLETYFKEQVIAKNYPFVACS